MKTLQIAFYVITVLLVGAACFFIWNKFSVMEEMEHANRIMEVSFEQQGKTQEQRNDSLRRTLSGDAKAKAVVATADSFYQYIDLTGKKLVSQQESLSPEAIKDLYLQISACQNKMLAQAPDSMQHAIGKTSFFVHTDIQMLQQGLTHASLAAAMAMLRKIEADCRQLEYGVLAAISR